MPKSILVSLGVVITVLILSAFYIQGQKHVWMKKGIDVQYQAWQRWEDRRTDEQNLARRDLQKEFAAATADWQARLDEANKRAVPAMQKLAQRPQTKVYTAAGEPMKCAETDIHLGSSFSETWNYLTKEYAQ